MIKDEIQAVVERMDAWSPDKQTIALRLLLWIEAADEVGADVSDADWADLQGGLAEADRGEFVSDEEMKAFFDKYR
jgi:predicted transcriptional regulator